ncbi:uncharacterized protein, partial [Chelonus insularis]|uniref:uncharacterized protein n=1 Tax=Chelonus insularis TaxID=460826 RepID=UPI00158CC330
MGTELCFVMPAMENLIGSNLTSVIGSLNAGLKASPTNYLQTFGSAMSAAAIESNITAAEKYLINVWKKNTHCQTFDEQRYWSYHHSNTMNVNELPPTSASMRLHILRAMYITYIQTHFMDQHENLDPNLFGYTQGDDNCTPQKIHTIIPPVDDLPPNCT